MIQRDSSHVFLCCSSTFPQCYNKDKTACSQPLEVPILIFETLEKWVVVVNVIYVSKFGGSHDTRANSSPQKIGARCVRAWSLYAFSPPKLPMSISFTITCRATLWYNRMTPRSFIGYPCNSSSSSHAHRNKSCCPILPIPLLRTFFSRHKTVDRLPPRRRWAGMNV